MPHPLLIFSQSDYLIQVVDTNSNTEWQTVQIQISWLLQKPTDQDLHCLQRQDISGFSRTRVKRDYTLHITVHIFSSQYEEVTLTEPMPSTVLEECVIPGYGKFTALSNGQVRIVFQDRTSLDMTCDFSKRINNCLEHSDENSLQQVCS